MRILQVCPYDWHAPGGVQTHVRNLSEQLMARGHEVLVAAPGLTAAAESWVRVIGRPIRVPFNGTVAPICPNPVAAVRLARLVRDFDPAIVHAHEPLAPSLGFYAALLARVPVVGTFHAHFDRRSGPQLYRCAAGFVNRYLAAGIAVSPVAMRCLQSGITVPFQIVPNGVDACFFNVRPRDARSRTQRLLFAHRLEPRKGFGILIDAFDRLADRYPALELVVVGDGPDRHLARRLPPAKRERLRMLGTLPRPQFFEEFARADVFVAPAVKGESFGIVLVEAMAAGLPIVASNVAGYRDVIRDGCEGALVPPGNPAALADAVSGMLDSADLAGACGVAGRARARQYSWTTIAHAIERVYEDATAPMLSERQPATI